MKSCKEFCQKLSEYLDGEIGKRECALIEEHLEKCPPCALTYESFKTTLQLCSQGLSDEVPKDVQDRLKEFLRQHCSKHNAEP